jgi:uncharacterized protein (TIGR03382 family)
MYPSISWLRLTALLLGPAVLGLPATGRAAEPDELTSEPPRGTYVVVPSDRLVDPVDPQEGGHPDPHILFLQRCSGGLELMPGDNDSIANTSTIVVAPSTLPDYPFGNESWQEVFTHTRAIFAPFNIEITDEDPGEVDHDEAVVCGDGSEIGVSAGGIAPFSPDCSIIPNAISFTFPVVLGNNPRLIAEVIAQEAAHVWGLDHAFLCEDPMTYLSGCGDKTFQDIDAECGEFEPRPCACGDPTQNSYQHILEAFGPAIPDVDGPVVIVTAPLTGTMFEEGDGYTVIVTITDESELTEAELFSNGQSVSVDTSAPWGWQINNVQGGIYTLEVVATDEYGNEGLSTPISILVGSDGGSGSGDEASDETVGGSLDDGTASDGGEETESAGAVDDGKGCGCTEGAPAPRYAVLPLLALLGLRRRRAAAHGPSPR